MDYIGKYLTPAFLVVLFILIITSITKPMGHFQRPIGEYMDAAFMTGFKEGYNTMDALASLAFGIVVINAIKSAGITDRKEIAGYMDIRYFCDGFNDADLWSHNIYGRFQY